MNTPDHNEQMAQAVEREGLAEELRLIQERNAMPQAARAEDQFPDETRERYLERKYYELLMAVASKFPGETRHQTALRYITEAENRRAEAYGPSAAQADEILGKQHYDH